MNSPAPSITAPWPSPTNSTGKTLPIKKGRSWKPITATCRLKDKSLADLDNLPDPDVLAKEIIENIEAGLENFKEIYNVLK